jgi:acetamidase/formamidase
MLGRPTIHITREQYHLAWDRNIPPVASVPTGTLIEIDTLDAGGGQISATSTVDDLANLYFSRVDQVNGPIAVDGAMPGDALEIDLLDLQPADWGWTASIPGFGLLADDFPEAALRITALGGRVAEFLPGVRVPVAPFRGEIGVAPDGDAPRSTTPPGEFGGNMDTKHVTAGTKLFLPVFAPGALFSLGDGHAAQGDGEVCGTAIETPMRVVVRLTVRKDLHVTGPEFLTPGPLARPATPGLPTQQMGSGRPAHGGPRCLATDDRLPRALAWN